MSDVFKDAAMKVAVNYKAVGGDAQAALDPTQILAWMEVLKALIEMLQGCRQAREVKAISENPSFLERRLVTNKVRNTLGLREFRKSGRETIEAIFKTGSEATEKEIQELYDAV